MPPTVFFGLAAREPCRFDSGFHSEPDMPKASNVGQNPSAVLSIAAEALWFLTYKTVVVVTDGEESPILALADFPVVIPSPLIYMACRFF
jgi:hypothetical protein